MTEFDCCRAGHGTTGATCGSVWRPVIPWSRGAAAAVGGAGRGRRLAARPERRFADYPLAEEAGVRQTAGTSRSGPAEQQVDPTFVSLRRGQLRLVVRTGTTPYRTNIRCVWQSSEAC
jgi:hypothetical protein